MVGHNLIDGIPYPDNRFSFVYHSHVLEHFGKNEAVEFIKECHRVLRPGGVFRVVVPDLESIAKQYIAFLKQALEQPSEYNHLNYEWSVIEMYDQTVRNFSGGEMGRLWSRPELPNESVIADRMGQEFLEFRKRIPLILEKPESLTAHDPTNLKNSI